MKSRCECALCRPGLFGYANQLEAVRTVLAGAFLGLDRTHAA